MEPTENAGEPVEVTEALSVERLDFQDGQTYVTARWRTWKVEHTPASRPTHQIFTAEVMFLCKGGRFMGGELRIRDADGVVEVMSISVGAVEDDVCS